MRPLTVAILIATVVALVILAIAGILRGVDE